MGRLKLESFFLDNKNKLKVRGEDIFVIDYLWHEVKGKKGFKTYTCEKLSDELIDYTPIRFHLCQLKKSLIGSKIVIPIFRFMHIRQHTKNL